MKVRHQLTVFGVRVSFQTDGAHDMEPARAFVEEHAERLQSGGRGLLGKDQVLALLALGVADDLMQSQRRLSEAETRLAALLKRIEESV